MSGVDKKSKKLRAGIVGCGRIASTFDSDPKRKNIATHAGAYTASPGVDLVAACDLDEKKVAAFGERWKVKNLYTNFNKMLKSEKLDILSLCTWAGSHFQLAKTAINSGVKAVFCEKPITVSLSEADQLIKLAKRKKVVFAVNHSRRWDSGLQKIKSAINQGKLGEIRQVSCYYTAGISNTGTHLFDLLNFFFGDAKQVIGAVSNLVDKKGADPTVSGLIEYKSGTLVSVQGLNVNDYLIFEIDIYGSKGRIRICNSGFKSQVWKVLPSDYFSGYKELKEVKSSFDLSKKEQMKNAVKDIMQCIKTKKKPSSSAKDGMKALELICAMKLSCKKGTKVDLPLKNRNITTE